MGWDGRKAGAAELVAREEAEYLRDEDPSTPIDPGIRPLVVLINALGYRTSGSCEGHGVQPGRITDTYVIVWVRRDQRQAWAEMAAAILLEPPLPVGASVTISRSGCWGEPDTHRFDLCLHYSYRPREDVAGVKAEAISSLTDWLDEWGAENLPPPLREARGGSAC